MREILIKFIYILLLGMAEILCTILLVGEIVALYKIFGNIVPTIIFEAVFVVISMWGAKTFNEEKNWYRPSTYIIGQIDFTLAVVRVVEMI